jgi:glycosyltransferase involved in cell wall biosynthesis
MKIGFYYVSPFPTVDADIVHIVQMCRTTASFGHQVQLFIPRRAEYGSDAAAIAEAERMFGKPLGFELVFVKRLTIFGKLQSLGSVIAARRALRLARPDLIHNLSPWACLFLPGLRIPFLFEVHEIDFHHSRFITKVMQRIVVHGSRSPWCRAIVAISSALKDRWIELGVPREKLLVAHDAVNMAMFKTLPSKQEARLNLGIDGQRPIVVHTGALYERYGIEMVIQAAEKLTDVQFYMVGGTPGDVERCRAQAETHGVNNMVFTGQVPHRDIPTWQAAADILLMQWSWRFPTMGVCSPMKMFEYMAAERLIVGPAFPTIKEVLRDGENAILFEPDNLEAMIAGLRRALALGNSTTMPKTARAEVAREYTWDVRCRKILAAVSDQ